MANSLRAKIKKLYHERKLTDGDMRELIVKLDGHDKELYNKAIDDFADRLCHKIKSEIDDCADELDWIDEIAEQLKEGGENDA